MASAAPSRSRARSSSRAKPKPSGKAGGKTKGGAKGRTVYDRIRGPLLWLAGVRILLGLAAIPLAPVLYEKHFLLLVLLRPTKEVLLAGAFLARKDKVGLIELIIAALPLTILGVWHFFALGRAYAKEIKSEKLPWLAKKILPTKKIEKLQKGLKKKGKRIVILGRVAVFPSALTGAAAGSSGMRSRDFLPADGIGGLLSMIEVIGAGYLLGATYKEAGPWITGAGIAALLAGMVAIGWLIRRE